MAFVGEFHMEKKNGKPFQLVYQQPKYQSSDGHIFQPLFTCPYARSVPGLREFDDRRFHPWRKALRRIKEIDHDDGDCYACDGSNSGTTYYFCDDCDKTFHKECIESPSEIKNPYHPEHSLQRYGHYGNLLPCLYCGREVKYWAYSCLTCNVVMHTICAMKPKPIPFFIDQPKRHDHPLTLFPRQGFLICNVCGLLRNRSLTYVCVECDFIAHEDCMNLPRIIKISRHNHRISHVSFLGSGEWSCGVCRKSVNSDYGAYSCDKCCDYVAHSRCATGKNVWDGEDLEGVPEDNDTAQDTEPFQVVGEGLILHFLHEHHLQLEVNSIYDEKKVCQGCVIPIFEGKFYSCTVECEYVLHETCAKAPRILQHALHPHPCTLNAECGYYTNFFFCDACHRRSSGFVYQCRLRECGFDLDLRCALITEPFNYEGHEHPLFLALDPAEKPICKVCKKECNKQLNCIKCDFILCMRCATLPEKARYKHEKHFLKVVCGEDWCEEDWCEVCERSLKDTGTKVFYRCNECCTSFHVECLYGKDPYIKAGHQFVLMYGKRVQVLHISYLSRPLCDSCKDPCQGNIFKTDNKIACSIKCGRSIW